MPSISCVSISGAAYAGVAKRQMSARRVIVSSPRAMVAEPMSMRQGSKEQSAICCSSVRLVVRNMILAGDRSRWMTGFTRPWVIKSARSTAFPTAATIWVVSPPEAS